MRKTAYPDRDFSSPHSEEFYLERDLTTPEGCYDECRVMVNRIIMVLRNEMRTKDAALHWLSRKYRLGSMPRKVCYGEPARIYAHHMNLLKKAFETIMHQHRLRAEHMERISRGLSS